MDELKKVKDGDDVEAIKKALEEANKTIQKIGEAMYKEQAQTPPEGAEGGEKPKEETPVEGEYEDVKEETKEDVKEEVKEEEPKQEEAK